jgi:hypothetical protein
MPSLHRVGLHRIGLVLALLIFGASPARAGEVGVEAGRMVERVFTNDGA